MSLLAGKRYAVRAAFRQKQWVMEVDSPSAALGLYHYLRFCQQSFQEDSDSLWQVVTKNCDPFFKKPCAAYRAQTALAILRELQPSLTPDNFPAEVDLRHLNELLHHVAVGFFSGPKTNQRSFLEVMGDLSGRLTEAVVHRALTADPLVVHKAITDLIQTKAVLREMDLVDLRVDFALKLLLHIYKRLFFNQVTTILSNLLAQVPEQSGDRPADTIVNYPLFIDFFRTIRTFFTEFVPFRHLKHFCNVTLDFKRKLFYYFFSYFRQALDVIPFAYTALLAVLNGVFYLVRENEQLVADFVQTFGDHEPFMKMLLTFKRSFFRLSDVVMDKTRLKVNAIVAERLADVPVAGFDIGMVLKRQLADLVGPLEKVHTFFRVKIIRHIFVAVLEEFVAKVAREGPEFTSSGDFGEALDRMTEFFAAPFENQSFENYRKFVEYYRGFLEGGSQGVCENALAMMKTILSEEMPDTSMELIIRTKDYGKVSFRQGKMLDAFHQMMERHKMGQAQGMRRAEARRKLGGMLLLGSNCFKFASICRRRLVKRKVNALVDDDPMPPTQDQPRNKVAQEKLDKFRKTIPMAFMEPSEFENLSGEEVKEAIRQAVLKSPPVSLTLALENEKLVVESDKKKLMRIFHPAKFSAIERMDVGGSKAVLLTYRQHERVVLLTTKAESQTKLFDKIGRLADIYKEVRFSGTRIHLCDPVKALFDTRALKQMLYRLRYVLTKPEFLPHTDLDCFPNWRYFGFVDPTVRTKPPPTIIKRRRSIEQLFSEENLRLLDAPNADRATFLNRLRDSNDPKAGNFASFGMGGLQGKYGTGPGDRREADGTEPKKQPSDGQITKKTPPGFGLPHSGRPGPQGINVESIADAKVESNFSSNENLFRSNDSRAFDVKVNPDLLFTIDEQPVRGKKLQQKV